MNAEREKYKESREIKLEHGEDKWTGKDTHNTSGG